MSIDSRAVIPSISSTSLGPWGCSWRTRSTKERERETTWEKDIKYEDERIQKIGIKIVKRKEERKGEIGYIYLPHGHDKKGEREKRGELHEKQLIQWLGNWQRYSSKKMLLLFGCQSHNFGVNQLTLGHNPIFFFLVKIMS